MHTALLFFHEPCMAVANRQPQTAREKQAAKQLQRMAKVGVVVLVSWCLGRVVSCKQPPAPGSQGEAGCTAHGQSVCARGRVGGGVLEEGLECVLLFFQG